MPEDTKAQLRVKIDIAQFIATEKLAFAKYLALCELEAYHSMAVASGLTGLVLAGPVFTFRIPRLRMPG